MNEWIIVVVAKKDGKIRLVWDGDYWKTSLMWAEAYSADEATAIAGRLRTKFPDLASEIEVTTPPKKQDWSPRRPELGAARRTKKEKPGGYTFRELSEAAKDRAIEAYIETNPTLFDQHDAEYLSDFMKRELADYYHLGDGLQVGWSLGYSQGDGVCFWGLVDIAEFLRAERKLKVFGEIINRATARILNDDSRYCHWNAMRVEVESHGTDVRDFLPKNMLERYTAFEYASRDRAHEQWAARNERMRPIQEWSQEVRQWEENIRKGKYRKQDWTPRGPHPPGPRPAEADVPIPPSLEMDPVLKRAYDRAAAEYDHFEQVLLNQFEDYLSERIKQISRELEKAGYAEIEYHSSSEWVSQILEDEDAKYTKDGERIED